MAFAQKQSLRQNSPYPDRVGWQSAGYPPYLLSDRLNDLSLLVKFVDGTKSFVNYLNCRFVRLLAASSFRKFLSPIVLGIGFAT